jgi:hypothetical protein
MKKEKCRICRKDFGKGKMYLVEYDIPKEKEKGLKVTCPKCKKAWFQKKIRENEPACEKCGYKEKFETEPYTKYYEIGDGCNCFICEECKKQVAESFRWE